MKFSIGTPWPKDVLTVEELDEVIELVQAVERLGLDAVSGSDHPFPVVTHGEAGHQALDPFVMLGHYAAVTQRIAMHVSLVVLPYRNPFLAARALATLDLLSRGRVIAAVGPGYLKAEFDAVGADFEDRGASLLPGVAAMRAAWSGEPVIMSGPGWHATGNTMRPRPVSTPRLPLWRGGNARKAIQQAVAEFDGWAPFEVGGDGSAQTASQEMSIATLPGRIALLREEIERVGRTEPLDVCYVRTGRKWLRDPAQVVEDLQALDAMGVTWVEFQITGRSGPEWIEGLEEFAALVTEAKLS